MRPFNLGRHKELSSEFMGRHDPSGICGTIGNLPSRRAGLKTSLITSPSGRRKSQTMKRLIAKFRRRRGKFFSPGARRLNAGTRWRQDFPNHKVINRGFGGSEILDCTHFADRIIFPYEPR